MPAWAAEPKPCDVLVIGSGVAGLLTALGTARLGRVVLVTKRSATDSNTNYAQGGVASAMDPRDSESSHVQDTMVCGAGLCRRSVVESVVRRGPLLIRRLMEYGARFSESEGVLHLGREGGHSAHRIVHYQDQTGREIERALFEAVLGEPRIEVREMTGAVDFIGGRRSAEEKTEETRVHGAHLLQDGVVVSQRARATVLATGGCGKAYLYTSNPDVATGDGIALAYRAGARIANMEFVQFHPTCLYNPNGSRFLVSEAVRGEGGLLRNAAGDAFMSRYDERKELAPRDIVARAIDEEMKRRGDRSVFLDVRHLGKTFLEQRFPAIYAACAAQGVQMEQDLVPVVPAAHYMCGGVLVDETGRTDLPGLYAIGETSCTGLHGANRLASNSLLEALAFAESAVRDLLAQTLPGVSESALEPWSYEGTERPEEGIVLEHDWDSTRRLLWDYVGIVRSDERLRIASERLTVLRRTADEYTRRFRPSLEFLELRNLELVGELIVRSARFRRESRGLHFTRSWPETRSEFQGDTVLSRLAPPALLPTEEPIVTVRGHSTDEA